MKLKKFVVGLVAGALMIASLSTATFAAKSPSTDKITPTVTPSGGGGGKTPTATPKGGSGSGGSSATGSAAVYASNITGEVIKYDGVDVSSPAILKALSDATIASARAQGTGGILKAVDCEDSASPNGKGSLYQNTITVRFKSSAFKAGMKITVLHQPDGSSKWEKITPDSLKNGECVVTFTSLSPVVFTAKGVSDKTGETAPMFAIAALLCLAGVVFFGMKTKFAK